MIVGKAFFDSNVLVYATTGSADTVKQTRALKLFNQYTISGQAVFSTQVVQEFYAVSKRLRADRQKLLEAVDLLLNLPLVINGPAQILSALALEDRYQISFWDALILAAAESAGAEVLFTEDLNDGQQYGSVLVRNPFVGSET